MPSVDIEGIGTVEFDDGMSQEDISSAIEKEIIPRHQKGIDLRSQLESARSEIFPALNRAGLAVSEFRLLPAQSRRLSLEEAARANRAMMAPIGGFGVETAPMTPKEAEFARGQQEADTAMVSGMSEVQNLPLAAAAAIPGVGRPMGLYFGAQALGTGAGELVEGMKEKDPELSGRGASQLTLGAAMTGAGLFSKPPTLEVPDAGEITSAKSVPQPEVRAPVGEETPLRQQGEAAAPQEEVAKAPAEDVLGTLTADRKTFNDLASQITELQKKGEILTPEGDFKPEIMENRRQSEAVKNKYGGNDPNVVTEEKATDFLKKAERVKPQDDWKVVVSEPRGEDPGYVQVVDPRASEESGAIKLPEGSPDFLKLPTGRYTYGEAVEKLKQMGESKPVEAAKSEPTSAPAAAKVEAEVAKVARTEGQRPAKEIKNEMVKQFSDALKQAPSEFDAVSAAVTKAGGKVELNADKFEQQKKALYGGKQIPQITIEIPGDGTFTVFNTKEALEGLLKRAKRLSTSPTEPTEVKKTGISKEDAADVQKILASPEPVGAAGPIAKSAGDVPIQDQISDAESRLLRLGQLRPDAFNLLVNIQSEASRRGMSDADYLTALQRGIVAAEGQMNPPGSTGPGAQARGESPYSPIQQLTDQLNAAAPAGAAERLKAGEKIAEQWSQGKSLVDRATARMRNITETLKNIARGVREVTDLDRAVAELDATLQQSAGESTNAKKALRKQMPNEFDRSAAAMSIEPASSPEILKEALKILPERTSPKVRRMLERAANPTPEMRQYAESLKQFFGIREQDAMQADLFQDGIRDYYTHVWGKEENMPDSLRGAFNSGRVSTYFQFARQRKIPTILEGIMEGKTPILDPAEVVPFYNYAMDRAIAGREFVRRLTDLDEKDGRPTVIVSGEGTRLEAGDNRDPAILIKPKAKPEEFQDYRTIRHPAMQKWKWATKTEQGEPVFMKGELVVHPDAYERIARMMDRDRLAPSPAMRVALRVGGEVKGLKLGGLPSLFHPVHVGTHAVFHWTNPFRTEAIQWDAPKTRFALEKGHLKLAPNPAELNVFAEGLGATGLAQRIPIIGQWNKAFSHWLFEDWIPRLKLKTFENAYARAQWMKKNLGAYKGLTDEQIAARTGDSVNNAYGELNHLFLGKMGRDPRFQRQLRLALLAPDFGEARLRFVEKAFTKYGHEERLALATMFTTLYVGARIANYLNHGDAEMDPRRMFSVKVGKHWWSMRSVLGDVVHALDQPGQFTYVRLSPLYSRTASDFLFGRDPRSGRKLSGRDKVENIAKQLVPIPLTGLTQEERTVWEGFFQSMGVSNIRDTPVMDVQKLATQWRQSKGLDAGSEFIPSEGPSYWKLRTALNLGRADHAANILADLRKTHSDGQIAQAMNTWARHPYTGSMQHEAQFLGTLTPPQHQLYQKARSEQMATLQDFYRLMAAHLGQRRSAQQPNRDLEILRSMAR